VDQARASRHAKVAYTAFDLQDWQTAQREFAIALEHADPLHWALSSYYGELAHALLKLNRIAESDAAYRNAIRVAIAQIGCFDDEAAVNLHFLAEQMIGRGDFAAALAELTQYPFETCRGNWYLWSSIARAQWAIGAKTEAKQAMQKCLDAAPSTDSRARCAAGFDEWIAQFK
jgi:hypothetical protein